MPITNKGEITRYILFIRAAGTMFPVVHLCEWKEVCSWVYLIRIVENIMSHPLCTFRSSRRISDRLPKTKEKQRSNVFCNLNRSAERNSKKKRKRYVSVLLQKPFHQQKTPKSKVTTPKTRQKTSISQRLRTNSGRSDGVTTATQLVWLNCFSASRPSH